MATLAALGKACARPAISAALWTQDHFFARKTHLSWRPRLYFLDGQGKTLAFVGNPVVSPAREIRVFSDPTLSFELLTIKPVARIEPRPFFEVHDPLNREAAGTIRQAWQGRFQRHHWLLANRAGEEVADIAEDSVLLSGMRRLFTELIPQTYTFMSAEIELGRAKQGGKILSSEMEIDLAPDVAKQLDRRLVAAAIVLLMAASLPDGKGRS